jgi:4-diphosphocytidyl-2-C-methyl-D-erythritol kinase
MSSSRTISRPAPAKLNLTLGILGRRADGFHEIHSWVVKLNWGDTMTVCDSDELELEIKGDSTGVPADGTNLVYLAADKLRNAASHRGGARIELEKRIPPGGGLGGGSSDAATALMCLNDLWSLSWPIDRLAALGSELGSDVALFFHGPSVIIRGRGERVEPGPVTKKMWAAVIIPPFGVSTAAVYQRHAARRDRQTTQAPVSQPSVAMSGVSAAMGAQEVASTLFNDLEHAAFECEPRLAALQAELDGLGGHRVRMTGSGSSLFGLFDTYAEAEAWREAALNRVSGGVRIQIAATAASPRVDAGDGIG